MEMKQIYEIWDRFESSSLSQLELSMNGVQISLKKEGAATTAVMPAPRVESQAPATEAKTSKQAEQKANGKCVKAPLVGTFYASPAPDAEPFVKVGDTVKKGDVIGIIEAMKLMNEVRAGESGVVTEILARDGGMVEYGQPLLTLE